MNDRTQIKTNVVASGIKVKLLRVSVQVMAKTTKTAADSMAIATKIELIPTEKPIGAIGMEGDLIVTVIGARGLGTPIVFVRIGAAAIAITYRLCLGGGTIIR